MWLRLILFYGRHESIKINHHFFQVLQNGYTFVFLKEFEFTHFTILMIYFYAKRYSNWSNRYHWNEINDVELPQQCKEFVFIRFLSRRIKPFVFCLKWLTKLDGYQVQRDMRRGMSRKFCLHSHTMRDCSSKYVCTEKEI